MKKAFRGKNGLLFIVESVEEDCEHVTHYLYENELAIGEEFFIKKNPDGPFRSHSLAIDTEENLLTVKKYRKNEWQF